MLLSDVFDSKIIDNESGCDWTGGILPKPWNDIALKITMFVELLFEQLVG